MMLEQAPSSKVILELPTLARRLKRMAFPELDCIIGIATGGTVPANLVAYQLELPLFLLHINYRAEDNRPQRPSPELIKPFKTIEPSSRVLLVDDVSVSGETLAAAMNLLQGHRVITCVMKGTADYVVFPEIKDCVAWPWKV